jgi:4-amino-4-deoxy-L-arabinose transferase-like glycosyltransferase
VLRAIPRADVRNLLLLFAGCGVVLILIPPQHEYPILDDWIYAGSVRTFQQTGAFVMPGMTQANLVGLTLWGALWTTLFGFGFTTLTYSTLFFAALALLSFYGIARAVAVPPAGALLGAVLLAADPFFLHLSYTFMTDIPFMALTLAACYLYIRGLQTGRLGWLLLGGLFAGWSFLIRQFGILAPGCFVLYLGIVSLQQKKWYWREALAMLAGPILLVGGWYAFLSWQGGGPTDMQIYADRQAAKFLWQPAWVEVVGLRTLSVLPLLGLFAWTAVRLRRSRWWLVPACLALLVAGMYAVDTPGQQWLPTTEYPFTLTVGSFALRLPRETFTFGARGNILRLGGIDFFQYEQQPIWTALAWRWLWVAAVGLAALLLAKCADGLMDWGRSLRRRAPLTPLAAFYGVGLATFIISVVFTGGFFDRYLLGFLPFVLMFLIRGTPAWGKLAWGYSLLAVGALACFSLLLKADMVSHDAARWQAAAWLLPKTGGLGLHGGFDWDNWRPPANPNYQISDLRTEGFRTEQRFPYVSLLSGGTTRYVLAEVLATLPLLPK